MKKVLSLLLALMMIFTAVMLAACAGDEKKPDETADKTETAADTSKEETTDAAQQTETKTPADTKEALKEAIEKTLALTSYEAAVTVKVNDITSVYAIKADATRSQCSRTVSTDGVSATVDVYAEDGLVFVKKGDSKTKGGSGSAEFKEYNIADVTKSIVTVIPADIAGEGQTKDGLTTVTVSLTEEQFKTTFETFAASMAAQATAMGQGEPTYSNAKAVVVYNDAGYVTEYTLSFDIAIGANSGAASAKVVYTNPGTDVTVPELADKDAYVG